MNDNRVVVDDDGRGFSLHWEGGNLFTVYKMNGQKLGEWQEDAEVTAEQAKEIMLAKKESGEYLNIIE